MTEGLESMPAPEPQPGSYEFYFRQAMANGFAEAAAQKDRDSAAKMARSQGISPDAPSAYVPFRNNYAFLVEYHADKYARIAHALGPEV